MNPQKLRIITLKLSIMALGLGVFFYNVRFFHMSSIVETTIFIGVIAAVRFFDFNFSHIENVHFESAFIIATLIIFSLPNSLFISIGGLLLATMIKPEKNIFGGPLYLISQRSLTIFLAGFWLNKHYLIAPGSERLIFFSWEAILILAACLTYFFVEILLSEINKAFNNATPLWVSFITSIQFLGQIYLALISIGILTALIYPSMGFYSLLIFSALLVVVRYSFRLFLDIKDTYRHTIAALCRIIEVEDPSQRGHSERVADLATDIAMEMRLTGNRLEAVGYAALLHDIGRLGLEEGSFDDYLDTDGITQKQLPHALIGAEMLEQVKFLRPFAKIVSKHHLPYEPNRRHNDIDHPLEARIITVANYYDQLTLGREASQRLTPNQAIAKIKKDAFQFDPKAIRSLITVLKKKRKLIVAR